MIDPKLLCLVFILSGCFYLVLTDEAPEKTTLGELLKKENVMENNEKTEAQKKQTLGELRQEENGMVTNKEITLKGKVLKKLKGVGAALCGNRPKVDGSASEELDDNKAVPHQSIDEEGNPLPEKSARLLKDFLTGRCAAGFPTKSFRRRTSSLIRRKSTSSAVEIPPTDGSGNNGEPIQTEKDKGGDTLAAHEEIKKKDGSGNNGEPIQTDKDKGGDTLTAHKEMNKREAGREIEVTGPTVSKESLVMTVKEGQEKDSIVQCAAKHKITEGAYNNMYYEFGLPQSNDEKCFVLCCLKEFSLFSDKGDPYKKTIKCGLSTKFFFLRNFNMKSDNPVLSTIDVNQFYQDSKKALEDAISGNPDRDMDPCEKSFFYMKRFYSYEHVSRIRDAVKEIRKQSARMEEEAKKKKEEEMKKKEEEMKKKEEGMTKKEEEKKKKE